MEVNQRMQEEGKSESLLLEEFNNLTLGIEDREQALLTLAKQYTVANDESKVDNLLNLANQLSARESKMYLAKIMKMLLDTVSQYDSETKGVELLLCRKILDWSIRENKNFLRFRLQIRLGNILYSRGEFTQARKEIDDVIKEARDVDDKNLLVESYLLESKLIYESKNYAKAKASLTACRANANKIYIHPVLQADIEKTAGILHLAEKDYRIAYSYFYEAFEAFHQSGDQKAAQDTFQYLILSKIMQDSVDEANNIAEGRYGQIYAKHIPLMLEILKAYQSKSLVDLSYILTQRRAEIAKNRIILSQIDFLYDQLLEKNIEKVITAYSRVQLGYLASKLRIEEDVIERKIGEMILDEKLLGSLDQENGMLILFDKKNVDTLFKDSLEVFDNIGLALDELAVRSEKLKVN